MTLTQLVKKATACRTFAELAELMDNGYVPTLTRSDEATQELANRLEALGYAVWRGK